MDTASLRAALVAVDPDLGRWRTAARATLASASAALIVSRAALALGHPATIPTMVAAVVSMLATALVSDETPRAQRLTSLLVPLPAAAGLVLGTLAAPSRAASAVLFVLGAFLAVLVRRFGPRGTALGLLGFNGFFFAQFAKATAGDLPWLIGAVLVAAVVAWIVRYHVVADRPEAQLQRSLDAVRSLVAIVLARTARGLAGPWQGRVRRRLRGALRKLNEAALGIDELVRAAEPGDPRGLRRRVFAVELATERAVTAARVVLMSGLVPPSARPALVDAVEAARTAILERREWPPGAIDAARAAVGECPLGAVQVEVLANALGDLVDAANVEPDEVRDAPAPADEPPPPAAQEGGIHPSTRQAIQVAVAAVLAAVAGAAISPSRWFWAVFAAFIVLTQATTVGEIARRAWHRTLGTILGVPLGLGVAALLRAHPRVEIAALFGCVFLAFWFLRASHAVMVTWLTAAVAILYGLLGAPTELLSVRTAETAAGAIIGATVATLLLPASTGRKVCATLAALLGDVAEHLDGALADGVRIGRARRLDLRLRDLRAAAEPLTRSPFPVAKGTVELVHAATTLVFYARQLELPETAAGEPPRAFALPVRRLAENARALADRLGGGSAPIASAAPLLEEARAEAAAQGAAREHAFAVYALARLDETLLEMAKVVSR